ncbi:hypothetical protein PNA2_1745 [Pyrococcus sp. NA2]|uniref:hypothetical protein n=1 Tax=Pyrococcus sp. (strain NA2) TaxID=342949 RepID=UPI000209AB2B|nr:hypothetical protein [Pyrococcus sp. NA2]AEC52660.1 hypothetical protein PNA2_1745 [Pyrococcus sp. NA2]
MVAMRSFGEAISKVIENPKVIIFPLIVLLLFSAPFAYLQKDMPLFEPLKPIEEYGNVIIEKHGATELPVGVNIWALIILAIFQVILLSGMEYSVIYYIDAEAGLREAFIQGLKNTIPAFIINIVIILIVFGVAILVAIPFIALLVLGGGAIALLLLLLAEIVVLGFLAGATSIILPAYVRSGSMGKAFGEISLTFKRKISTFGFGILLILASIALILAGGIAGGVVIIFSHSFIALLIARILQAPFLAILYAFSAIAGLIYYDNLLNLESALTSDVRVDRGFEIEEDNQV